MTKFVITLQCHSKNFHHYSKTLFSFNRQSQYNDALDQYKSTRCLFYSALSPTNGSYMSLLLFLIIIIKQELKAQINRKKLQMCHDDSYWQTIVHMQQRLQLFSETEQ